MATNKKQVIIRQRIDEHEMIKEAAKADNRSISQFYANATIKEAKRILNKDKTA